MTVLRTDTPEVNNKIAGLTIRTADEITENNGVFITIYGSPGSGKTTLASSLAKYPQFTPLLYIDVEGGMGVVDPDDVRSGAVDPVNPTQFEQINAVRQAFVTKRLPREYKTVVVDNMSEVLTLCKRFICHDNDAPSQPEWGKITDTMLQMTRDWRDLSKTTGVNVVFLAWDNPDKDETNVVKNNLYFTPALREQFPGIVDIVGHIGSQNGVRVLDFQWNPKKTQAKFRRSTRANARKIPEKIPYGLDNMPLGDILTVLREDDAEWPTNKYNRQTQTQEEKS